MIPVRGFVRWYLEPLRRFGDIAGRAGRQEYWTFTAVNMLVAWALGWADRTLGLGYQENLGFGVLGGLFGLVLAIPGLAVAIRRLHDTGRRGTWMFLLLVPLVGPIALAALLLFQSQAGTNSYGPPPGGGAYGPFFARPGWAFRWRTNDPCRHVGTSRKRALRCLWSFLLRSGSVLWRLRSAATGGDLPGESSPAQQHSRQPPSSRLQWPEERQDLVGDLQRAACVLYRLDPFPRHGRADDL